MNNSTGHCRLLYSHQQNVRLRALQNSEKNFLCHFPFLKFICIFKYEVKLFARCLLLVTLCSLLVTFCLLHFTFCLLLSACFRYFLLVARYILLVACYFLVVASYFFVHCMLGKCNIN